jgi:tetratricopeptide (TPR) repeat protein
LTEAVTAFDQAIALHPMYARALFYRAQAYQKLGKTTRAIDDYAEAIRLHKAMVAKPGEQADPAALLRPGDLADAYCNRGRLLNQAGKPDQAIDAFTECLRFDPKCVDAYCGRGTVFNQGGRPEKAIDDFTEALRLNPQIAEAYCGRGIAFLAKDLPDVAVEDLTEAMRLDPTSHEAFCQRGRACLAMGNEQAAIKDCRRAIRSDPKCAVAFRTLGSALSSSPDPQFAEAVTSYQEAIRLDNHLAAQVNPELAKAYFNWGVSLEREGAQTDADNAFSQAEKLDAKYVALRLEHEKKTRPAASGPLVVTVLKPIEVDPKPAQFNHQGFASFERGEFDKAIQDFTNAIRIDPKSADAWYGRGSAFLEKGFPDTALADFDQAIGFRPTAQTYYQRARAFAMAGNYSRAVEDGTEAIRLKYDFALAYYQRALAYLQDNNFDRALADLDEAVRLDPKLQSQAQPWLAKAYRGKGIIQLSAKRWDEALDSLGGAIRAEPKWAKPLSPQLADAYRGRGFDHENNNECAEAIRDLDEAVRWDPANAQNYRVRGLTYYKMAKWDLASADLKRTIRLDPDLEYKLRRTLDEAERHGAVVSFAPVPTQ